MSFAYDGNSQMFSRTDDNGATTMFVYDELDRLTEQIHTDSTNDARGLRVRRLAHLRAAGSARCR